MSVPPGTHNTVDLPTRAKNNFRGSYFSKVNARYVGSA